jgi:hypothetical protein
MAAEAAWVITTVIAAADKAIRIDIEETPDKGRKGTTDGKQWENHAKPSRRRVSARQGRRAPFQHLQTDQCKMPRYWIDASNRAEIILNTAWMLIQILVQKKSRPARWRWAGVYL